MADVFYMSRVLPTMFHRWRKTALLGRLALNARAEFAERERERLFNAWRASVQGRLERLDAFRERWGVFMPVRSAFLRWRREVVEGRIARTFQHTSMLRAWRRLHARLALAAERYVAFSRAVVCLAGVPQVPTARARNGRDDVVALGVASSAHACAQVCGALDRVVRARVG